MNYLTKEKKSCLVKFEKTIVPREGSFVRILIDTYDRIVKNGEDNAEYARNILCAVREQINKNIMFAEKVKKQDIVYRPLDDSIIQQLVKDNKNLKNQIHEIALFVILCIIFKATKLDYVVGITSQGNDGHIDVAVSKKIGDNYECEMLFDMKSGKTYTNAHIHDWNIINGDKIHIKLIRYGKDVGKYINERDEEAGVFVISLENFIVNFATAITWGCNFTEVNKMVNVIDFYSNKI